ncbi:MAG: hypothetical protein CVU79_02645 [Elusimicrobia bacterium HGW-Elusimicrobia-3]|nr:MAG: hypothetical protein CVU79_02645 [Elusimicrobia bacterium HGW-Elusimicrobia-3]
MADEARKSGWKIWVYLTPVYIIIAIPLLMWIKKINSSDVGLSKEEYNVFNASEGEVKKRRQQKNYDPGLTDIGYTVRYRSGDAPEGSLGGDGPSKEAEERVREAAAARGQQAAAGEQGYKPKPAAQAALESSDTRAKEQMGLGNQKGYLTYAVGKTMNNPKAVAALMNNSWVVKGFMGRSTVKGALGSPEGLNNYLKNTTAVNNFLGNSVVQAAIKNPAVVNAFAGSAMAGAILSSPGVQGLMQNPQALMEMANTNPEVMQLLSNPNVMAALMNNPQTAGLAANLGGGFAPK